MKPRILTVAALALVPLLAGCGSSGGDGGLTGPDIGAARTYALAGFTPTGQVPRAGRPTTVSFAIRQPSGAPLTAYKTGPGPHTGVHVIIVRDDLSSIIHRHPPVAADGTIRERVVFPTPGRYRVLVDAYPATGAQPNFQLTRDVRVAGPVGRKLLPAFHAVQEVGGYRFTMHGTPHLKAIRPAFLTVTVRDAQGRRARFTTWYGALAHAIFFRAGTLDYFHTHVCAPNASGCTSNLGGAKVTGKSSTPGRLQVGVLLPVPGTWVLFLQCKIGGRVRSVPYTLKVT